MTDYGHDLLFGTFITPTNTDPQVPVRLAQLSEQLGLDLVTFQDHPYQPSFLDTWTLMSWVAAQTERIHISGNVLNLGMRPPAHLARAAPACFTDHRHPVAKCAHSGRSRISPAAELHCPILSLAIRRPMKRCHSTIDSTGCRVRRRSATGGYFRRSPLGGPPVRRAARCGPPPGTGSLLSGRCGRLRMLQF